MIIEKKNKNAFSVAELIIATIFLGIIMATIIPSIGKNIIAKERITAYNLAFKKVYDAAAEAMIIPPATEPQAQILWGTLDKNLPIIGYIDKDCGHTSGAGIFTSKCKLRRGAKWHKDQFEKNPDGSYKLDSDGNKIVISSDYSFLGDPNDKVENEAGPSPWLVTENGISYSVNTTDATFSCQRTSVLYTLVPKNGEIKAERERLSDSPTLNMNNINIEKFSCADVYIDVNGPNVGPNKFCNVLLTKDEFMRDITKCDRFHAYVTYDGLSTGPYDQTNKTAYIEHWMHQRK